MNKSESVKELAVALSKAQAQMGVAVKDSVNPYYSSRYADLASIWDACREALTKNGLSVVQFPIDVEPGRIGLETILLHTSGEWLAQTASTRLAKDDPQGVGSGLTYLRRYALAAVVGVVSDDDDGSAASDSRRREDTAPAPKIPRSKKEHAEAINRQAKEGEKQEPSADEWLTAAEQLREVHLRLQARKQSWGDLFSAYSKEPYWAEKAEDVRAYMNKRNYEAQYPVTTRHVEEVARVLGTKACEWLYKNVKVPEAAKTA